MQELGCVCRRPSNLRPQCEKGWQLSQVDSVCVLPVQVPEFLAFRRRAARSRTFLEVTCEQGLLMMRTAFREGLAKTTKVQQAAKEIHQRVKFVVVEYNDVFRTQESHCSAEDSTTNEDLSQLPQWLPPVACTR